MLHNSMTSLLATTLTTSTINGNTGSTLTIGNNLTTNAIQIGTSTNTVTIGGASTATTVGGTLGVTGNTTIGGTLGVTGNTTIGGTLGVTGNTTIGGTLGVTGNTTISGTLTTSTINGVTESTLTIGNNLTTNAIQIGTSTNTISIGATGCTTTVGGTLKTSTINGNAGSTLSIGTNLTSEQLQIGSLMNSTNINLRGATYVYGNLSVDYGDAIMSQSTRTAGLVLTGNNNITLGNGATAASSGQLGYKITTTSVNTNATSGTINKVRFATPFICFSNNDGSTYYGILLSPGTWLIHYTIVFQTDLSIENWIYFGNSYLNYNSTVSAYGTLVAKEGQDAFNFKQAANSGYLLNNSNLVYLKGSAVQQITENRYYNVRTSISSVSASGTLNIDASYLTAVRIA